MINGSVLGNTFQQKCDSLETLGNAVVVFGDSFMEDLVCVVDNGAFAAVGYAFDEREFTLFKEGLGGRRCQWYILPDAKEHVDK